MKLFLFIIIPAMLFGQTYTYAGIIRDKNTSEPLTGASIQIIGTSEGIISDTNGEFVLITSQKNAQIECTMVGYHTVYKTLSSQMEIYLEESLYKSAVVDVSTDKLSPAEKLAFSVMGKQKNARKDLNAFYREGYSKTYFYRPKTEKDKRKDDSLRNIGKEDDIKPRVPFLAESHKSISWKSPNLIKQKILRRKQGKAFIKQFNLFGASEYYDVFDKTMFTHISPLNKDGFENYFYHLTDTITFNNDSTYILHVTPIDTANHWKYDFFIHARTHKLQRFYAQLIANKFQTYFKLLGIIDFRGKHVTIQQDFEEFEGITFPKNLTIQHLFKETGRARIFEEFFPPQINGETENIYLGKQEMTVSKDVDKVDEVYWEKKRPDSLTFSEKTAYVKSDSLYNTYSPTRKFLREKVLKLLFLDYYLYSHKITKLTDLYHFNPVEGHYLGLGLKWNLKSDHSLTTQTAYSTGQEQFTGEAIYSFPLSKKHEVDVTFHPFSKIRAIDQRNFFGQLTETFLGYKSHKRKHHYFKEEGGEVTIFKRFSSQLSASLNVSKKHLSSLVNGSDFSVFNTDRIYKQNISIQDTDEERIDFRLKYSDSKEFDLGTFQFTTFDKNGWDIDFNASLYKTSQMNFKKFSLNVFKQISYSRKYRSQFKLNAHYVGKSVATQYLFFPSVFDTLGKQNHEMISGFKIYELASNDFYSLSHHFRINRLFSFLQPGNLTISTKTFISNNYGETFTNGIELVPDKLHGEIGISLVESFGIVPMRFSVNYNTWKQSTYFHYAFVRVF